MFCWQMILHNLRNFTLNSVIFFLFLKVDFLHCRVFLTQVPALIVKVKENCSWSFSDSSSCWLLDRRVRGRLQSQRLEGGSSGGDGAVG